MHFRLVGDEIIIGVINANWPPMDALLIQKFLFIL
jgi:hypothetical protein